MTDKTPTDAELKEVGLEREEFENLEKDGKTYVLDRLRSYDRLDKLYQIMEVIQAIETEKKQDTLTILSSEENRKKIVDAVKEYRKQDRAESIGEFYRKRAKK